MANAGRAGSALVWGMAVLLGGAVHANAQVHAPAQEPVPVPAQTAGEVTDLAPVLVSGVQPGPGMWQVRNSQGHTLWILGTVSPLPAKLDWRADEVQAVIASAQEVLGSPGWTLDADVGFFRRLTLAPAAMKAARDPDGRTLREVLPPDLYARWALLKQRHIGRDNGIEKDRPLVAATQLYAAALKDVGLGRSSPVSRIIEKASKAHGLKPVSTQVTIKIADARQALKEVRGTALQDVECFRRTLEVIEHGLPLLAERANAWAVGDIQALQRLAVKGQYVACVDAVANSDFGRRRGLTDVDAQAHRKWISMASDALARNAVTFATVPVTSLVTPGGYIDQLRERGFEVQIPE